MTVMHYACPSCGSEEIEVEATLWVPVVDGYADLSVGYYENTSDVAGAVEFGPDSQARCLNDECGGAGYLRAFVAEEQ